MKYRNGFVSNSSSSSFVLVVTTEAHEKAMAQLSPWAQSVIEGIKDGHQSLAGTPVVIFSEYLDRGGYGTFDGEDELGDPSLITDKDNERYGKMGYGEEGEASTYEVWSVYGKLIPDDQKVFGGSDY